MLVVPDAPNLVLSRDFLVDRRQCRLLTVLGDFNRVGLGIELDLSLSIFRVVRFVGPVRRVNGPSDRFLIGSDRAGSRSAPR